MRTSRRKPPPQRIYRCETTRIGDPLRNSTTQYLSHPGDWWPGVSVRQDADGYVHVYSEGTIRWERPPDWSIPLA